jgi:hypothetical protein
LDFKNPTSRFLAGDDSRVTPFTSITQQQTAESGQGAVRDSSGLRLSAVKVICLMDPVATVFNNAYKPFKKGLPIPKDTLDNLTQFTLSSDKYHALVTSRELERGRGRFIFLDEGKTKVDHATLPPHGEIIAEVTTQIGIQDRPHKPFIPGIANSMSFGGVSAKCNSSGSFFFMNLDIK